MKKDDRFIFGSFGNGITICDKKENTHVGHISEAGDLKWYDGFEPSEELLAEAEKFAKQNEKAYDEKFEDVLGMRKDTLLAKSNRDYFVGKLYEDYLERCSHTQYQECLRQGFKTMEESLRYLKPILKAEHKI